MSRSPFSLPPEAFLHHRATPPFYRAVTCTPSTAESRAAVTARSAKFVSSRPASPRTGGAQFTIIANVPYDTVRQDLVSEFRKFGRVELAMVVCDEASRHPHKEWTSTAGYAFVRFSKRTEAAAAIQAATIGLITIRGTRVRADWARKDSYAKRGRVSPAQGAPALGPFGVPDGISLLRDSLNGRSAEGWQMPAAYGRPEEAPPQWPATPSRNEAVLKALETAFASAFDFVNNSSSTAPEADGGAHHIDPFGGSETKRIDPSFPPVTLLPLRLHHHDDATTSTVPSIFTRPEHLDSVLSPVSRNLLAGALSDVTAPEGFFLTDVSPLAGTTGPSQMSARFFSSAFDKSILLPPDEDDAAAAESVAGPGEEGSDFTTTNPSPACESTASDFSSSEDGDPLNHAAHGGSPPSS